LERDEEAKYIDLLRVRENVWK